MDFTLPADIERLRLKVRDFVAAEVLPLESRPEIYDQYENIKLDVLDEMRAAAGDPDPEPDHDDPRRCRGCGVRAACAYRLDQG